jgi:CrcB protein
MKEYIYIGFGGFTGAILRYLASDIDLFSVPAINTFFINITGSFILSFIVFSEIIKNIKIKKSFTMGLLGSFTTFSTFSGEAFDMLMNDKTPPVYMLYLFIGNLWINCSIFGLYNIK